MNDRWFYFGCGQEPGHYLFDQTGRALWSPEPKFKRLRDSFDGILPPQPETEDGLYVASFSRLGGYGLSALSWWDRSQDKRGGCNSTIFAPSLDIAPQTMLAEAQARFPWVFSRLPQPLKLALNQPTHQHADGGVYEFMGHGAGKGDEGDAWMPAVFYRGPDGIIRWTTPARWERRFTEIAGG